MEEHLVTILLKIQEDCAATRSQVDALSGPTGRVTQLEKKSDEQARWSLIYNVCVIPALGLAHAVARHFGVNV